MMTDMQIIELAFDILDDADVIEVFDDSLFIKIDKEMWETYWATMNAPNQDDLTVLDAGESE